MSSLLRESSSSYTSLKSLHLGRELLAGRRSSSTSFIANFSSAAASGGGRRDVPPDPSVDPSEMIGTGTWDEFSRSRAASLSRSRFRSAGGNVEVSADANAPVAEIDAEEQSKLKSRAAWIHKYFGWALNLMGYNSSASVRLRASFRIYDNALTAAYREELYVAPGLRPDFRVWFELTLLHVWMVFVRLRTEPNGKELSQDLFNRFWEDMEEELRRRGIDSQSRQDAIRKSLAESYLGSLVAYDEGLRGSDSALAGALWRNLFALSPLAHASDLSRYTAYVRAQVSELDKTPSEVVLNGSFVWARISPGTAGYE